ncbi:MAG: fumarylacetoacetate hydrolase family protein [Acidobacteria bacterium]|nr:fumarylacetoacetate hydrolase family protein [Acidobacteriota bacterium]
MRIVRYEHGGIIGYGQIHDERILPIADPFTETAPTFDAGIAVSEARLVAPVQPRKIVGVGRNYADHAKELGNELPSTPLIFLKPGTSVIGPGESIIRPASSSRVDFEGELAIVIGRRCRNLGDDWRSVIIGFTCGNDVTARDLQKFDGQFTRGKGFDTFCPLGPWIETDLDPDDVAVTTRVNGSVRQQGRTSQMIFDCGAILGFVSSVMTLEPGDVILTGTPEGVGPLERGDEVSVEIENLGILSNRVE